ncbi:14629_t:CDS:2 [Entrophospora sp. SA101]|nr:14629_t:CDS:2 [Entrophospora sp. SA101]
MVESHKEARKASRRKLIAHLNNCQGIYHPSNLHTFEERVSDYLPEEKRESGPSAILSAIGAAIGGLAAGPTGAVIGASLGAALGQQL